MDIPIPEGVRILSAILSANVTPEVKRYLFDTRRSVETQSKAATSRSAAITQPIKTVPLPTNFSV